MLAWIEKNITFIRIAILIVAIMSFAGPWAFDRIMVPGRYECSSPHVRLEGEFCGLPLVGIQITIMTAIGIIQTVAGYLDGTTQFGELIRIISIGIPLFLLPSPIFIGSAFSLRRHGTKRAVPVSAAWALAALVALLHGVVGFSAFHFANWGTWLYAALSATAFVCELPILIKSANT